MLDPAPTAWIVTDGKAGDEAQCIGVADALGLMTSVRRVAPRAPWSWLMPWGPIDPAERPGRPGSPIAPPFPDLLIASGRRAAAYVRHVKRAAGGRTFTVVLKDPRVGAGAADLIWVPEHDRLRGPNVISTLTPPHRISAERLAQARANPPPAIAALAPPRAAVLVGGDSRHFTFSDDDVRAFASQLAALADSGVALMGTLSRRTPASLGATVRHVFDHHGGWLWDGSGENPLIPLLAMADAIVATADSTNMVGEAAATGKPILVFTPGGRGHRKITHFLDEMRVKGIVHNFAGRLEGKPYPPLDSTPEIAEAIAKRYRALRRTHP
ncbi:MAG: mitochondrial fission ELM1 family protein [Beijerinckiaceae bacterium]